MVGKLRGKTGKNRKPIPGAEVFVRGDAWEGIGSGVAERIVGIARPFIAEIAREDDRDRVVRSILGFAVAAWNVPLLSPEQGNELLATVTMVPGLTVAELKELRDKVDAMVRRRKELFPDDLRYVDNYRFSGAGEELRFEARVLPK